MSSRSRVSCVVIVSVMGFTGCAFKPNRDGPGGGGHGGGIGAAGGTFVGATGGTAFIIPPCVNLQCQQTTCVGPMCVVPACTGGVRTTVSGTVYDPAGKVPLYGVTVYVPNAALKELTDGAACVPCTATSGDPVVKTATDSAGHFSLDNVPAGTDIPLVIQVGKWRRETTISRVTPCMDNPQADKDMTRLPRNQTEGHIPKIALTTGNVDALECLLRKIGIEDSEFTPETGMGRVNLYAGGNPTSMEGVGTNAYLPMLNGGAPFTNAQGWWDDAANLVKYDILLHSCDGLSNPGDVLRGPAALQAFQNYTHSGGRAFLSHWHNYWVERGPPPFPMVARFNHQDDLAIPFTATIDTTFPKGLALAEWLVNVGGSTTLGDLVIQGAQHTIDTVNATAQRWIYSTTPVSTQYLTFNTPIVPAPGQAQCGKVVVSDIHVSSGSGNAMTDDISRPMFPFPMGCRTMDLSPQEKALEFMLFDLSACSPPGIP